MEEKAVRFVGCLGFDLVSSLKANDFFIFYFLRKQITGSSGSSLFRNFYGYIVANL